MTHLQSVTKTCCTQVLLVSNLLFETNKTEHGCNTWSCLGTQSTGKGEGAFEQKNSLKSFVVPQQQNFIPTHQSEERKQGNLWIRLQELCTCTRSHKSTQQCSYAPNGAIHFHQDLT